MTAPLVPAATPTAGFVHTTALRVRYSETDQMGTFYNSRALEWFEVARTDLLRALGLPYAEMESRGILLPLVEAHLAFRGRAKYDDPLALTSRLTLAGKATLRFDVEIAHAPGSPRSGPVVSGWTLHAITDATGKPTRSPDWLTAKIPVSRAPHPITNDR